MNLALTVPVLGPALPEIILAIGVLILVLFGAFRGERSADLMNIGALALLAVALIAVVAAAGRTGRGASTAPSWSTPSPSS